MTIAARLAAGVLAVALASPAAAEVPPETSTGGEGQADEALATSDVRRTRITLTAEALLSGWSQGAEAVGGGRLALRAGPLVGALSVETATESPRAQPELVAVVLVGVGLAREVGERVSVHAMGLLGSSLFAIRDYVDGGFVDVGEPAVGARVGAELRLSSPHVPRYNPHFTPFVGLAATALHMSRTSDRLRGVSWGGPSVGVTLTVGLEIASPPRNPYRERAWAPPAEAERPPAPPAPPCLPRLTLELVAPGTSIGDGPKLIGGTRLTVGLPRGTAIAASADMGEDGAGEVHKLVTAGGGVRTLRRGFTLEALAIAGLHRVEVRGPDGRWESVDLPAAGARLAVLRSLRGRRASFLYGLWAELVATRAGARPFGGEVGTLAGLFGASIGLAF